MGGLTVRRRLTTCPTGGSVKVRVLIFASITAAAFAQQQQQPATQFGDNGQTLNGGRLDRRGKNRPPAGPTPRLPNGQVNLSVEPGQTGLWEGNAGATLARNLRNAIDNPFMNLPSNL